MENDRKLSWREPPAVLLAVLLSDAVIYHGAGFAGMAALLGGLLLIFFFGVSPSRFDGKTALFSLLLVLAAWKLCWCGRVQTVLLGLGCLWIVAALLTRCPIEPYNLFSYLFQSVATGGHRIGRYIVEIAKRCRPIRSMELAAILIPLCFVIVFSCIFIFANPNLLAWIQNAWDRFLDWFPTPWDWFPAPLQVLLWGGVALMMFGLLSPRLRHRSTSLPEVLREMFRPPLIYDRLPAGFPNPSFSKQDAAGQNAPTATIEPSKHSDDPSDPPASDSPFYQIGRNTLLALIVLFAVYLVFEFRMNWLRHFPENLDYSAYMHQGAMLLTAALALSTVVLCVIFQKSVLVDSRISRLRRLAWIWSALNIFLAISIYNRLGIYIELNGLSRLRVMGILGVTAVLFGLLLVVWKVAAAKRFRWLLAGYTWSVLLVVFVYFVAPVDSVIARHNVRRVMNGELLPAIFLLHVDSAEDLLYSLPLLNCPDETIREGSRAIISERWRKLQVKRKDRPKGTYSWTRFQYAEEKIVKELSGYDSLLESFSGDPPLRKETIDRFRRYTNRWIN